MPDADQPALNAKARVDEATIAPYLTGLFQSCEAAKRARDRLLERSVITAADVRLYPDILENSDQPADVDATGEDNGMLQRLADHMARVRSAALEADGEDHPGYLMILQISTNAQQSAIMVTLMEEEASDIEEHWSFEEAASYEKTGSEDEPDIK